MYSSTVSPYHKLPPKSKSKKKPLSKPKPPPQVYAQTPNSAFNNALYFQPGTSNSGVYTYPGTSNTQMNSSIYSLPSTSNMMNSSIYSMAGSSNMYGGVYSQGVPNVTVNGAFYAQPAVSNMSGGTYSQLPTYPTKVRTEPIFGPADRQLSPQEMSLLKIAVKNGHYGMPADASFAYDPQANSTSHTSASPVVYYPTPGTSNPFVSYSPTQASATVTAGNHSSDGRQTSPSPAQSQGARSKSNSPEFKSPDAREPPWRNQTSSPPSQKDNASAVASPQTQKVPIDGTGTQAEDLTIDLTHEEGDEEEEGMDGNSNFQSDFNYSQYYVLSELDFKAYTKFIKSKGTVEDTACCCFCMYHSSDVEDLIKHYFVRHPRLYCCRTCSYVATEYSRIDGHACTRSNPQIPDKPFPCPNCPIKFAVEENLSVHIRSVHKPLMDVSKYISDNKTKSCDVDFWKPVPPCPFCTYKCGNISGLRHHIQLFHKYKPLCLCPFCKFITTTPESLVMHSLQMHFSTIPLPCTFCEFRGSATSLEHHFKQKHKSFTFLPELVFREFIETMSLSVYYGEVGMKHQNAMIDVCHTYGPYFTNSQSPPVGDLSRANPHSSQLSSKNSPPPACVPNPYHPESAEYFIFKHIIGGCVKRLVTDKAGPSSEAMSGRVDIPYLQQPPPQQTMDLRYLQQPLHQNTPPRPAEGSCHRSPDIAEGVDMSQGADYSLPLEPNVVIDEEQPKADMNENVASYSFGNHFLAS